MDIKILYEDTDLIVCVKPAGVAAETKKITQQDMVSILRNYRSRQKEEAYIGLIHRLDQPVEGILVFAKHTAAAAALSRQLAKGAFTKYYLAVAQGAMPKQQGVLEDYLKKDGRRQTAYIADIADPQAKRAQLQYQVLETITCTDLEDCFLSDFAYMDRDTVLSLVKIKLVTGRFHQIRVQMAHLGTPLAGDFKYNQRCTQAGQQEGQLALCAYELEFTHPMTKKKLAFHIMPSAQLFQLFQTLHNFDILTKK